MLASRTPRVLYSCRTYRHHPAILLCWSPFAAATHPRTHLHPQHPPTQQFYCAGHPLLQLPTHAHTCTHNIHPQAATKAHTHPQSHLHPPTSTAQRSAHCPPRTPLLCTPHARDAPPACAACPRRRLPPSPWCCAGRPAAAAHPRAPLPGWLPQPGPPAAQ